MSQLKWNSVSADFSGANQAMNASTNALSSAGDIFSKLTNQIEQQKQNDLDEAFRQESFRLQEQEAIRQQEQHALTMLNEKESMEAADLVRQWDKEFLNPDGTYNIVAMGEVASQAEFATSGASQYIADELQKRLGINFNYEQMRSENATKLLKNNQAQGSLIAEAALVGFQKYTQDTPGGSPQEWMELLRSSKLDSDRELLATLENNEFGLTEFFEKSRAISQTSHKEQQEREQEYREKQTKKAQEQGLSFGNTQTLAKEIYESLPGNTGLLTIDDFSLASLEASLGKLSSNDSLKGTLDTEIIKATVGALSQVDSKIFGEDEKKLRTNYAEDLETLVEDFQGEGKPNDVLALALVNAASTKELPAEQIAWLRKHHGDLLISGDKSQGPTNVFTTVTPNSALASLLEDTKVPHDPERELNNLNKALNTLY